MFMGFKLVIAEKPSVAKEIANVIGANSRKTGYYEGNGYIVSNAVGHLLQLAEAHIYNEQYKKWTLEDLPIIPEQFKLVVTESTKEQYKILKELLLRNDVVEVVCATDAGREGELIFRLIYNSVGSKKPCKRLWISSLTEESILKGMDSLKDIEEYNNLYVSAYARAKADWLFGINFTRLFSVKNDNKLTAGRVQTPTLHLIVKRDYEIENFIKEKYFTIKMDNGATWFKSDVDSLKAKSDAEKIKDKCTGKTSTVQDVKTEKKTENRPLLYSLTSLQRDANKKLGFSAMKTLNIAQKLYEAKLATYPRTDSNYLSDDMRADVEATVAKIGEFYKIDMVNAIVKEGLNLDSRIFNNDKVTDHHAIIPTKEISKMNQDLSQDEKAILEMIIERFLLILSAPHVYNVTTYTFVVEGETFRATSRKVIQEGFKKFIQAEKKNKELEDGCVEGLNYSLGDSFKVKSLEILERHTKPKEHFTEDTLLSVMENIDREIDDEELKKYVKERGLGTPATRASIIEKLIQVKYIERKGKNLMSTSLGRKFIAAIPPAVKDIDLTANWEQTLIDIEKGKASDKKFLEDIIQNITVVVTLESTRTGEQIKMDKEVIGICPRCEKQIFEGEKAFYCEGYQGSPKCEFTIWKKDKFFEEKGKSITKDIAIKLLKGQKVLIKGLKNKDGSKTYDAYVSMQDTGKYINFKLDFEKSEDEIIKCPRCGKKVLENEKSFYCSGYKDEPKCGFSIWKNDKFFAEKGKTLTKSMVEKLIAGKKVLVKDLKAKDGEKSYDAYIVIQDTGKYINFKVESYVNKDKK